MDHDFSGLRQKIDAHKRPMWVCPNASVFLETFVPTSVYQASYDFLIAISDPVSRYKPVSCGFKDLYGAGRAAPESVSVRVEMGGLGWTICGY